MTGFDFVEATKEQAKARVALAGPSGSGKTWTSMILATVFSHGERFAVIDTERGSASKYSDVFQFDRLNMYEYDPRDLIKAIAAAEKRGYPCLAVDSLSRFWSGKAGMLELVDNVTRRTSHGNAFSSGWKEARPIENDMIEAMLGFSGHLIVTMRVKTAYDITKNERGQTVPVKIGLQPEQRGGIEYEFDVVGDMDLENNLTIAKTRCPDLTGKVYNRPGPDVGAVILSWLDDGVAGVSVNDFRDRAMDPSITFEGLGQLKQEVRAAGKSGAMTTDDRPGRGDVISLETLINRRGNEVKGGPAVQGGATVTHVRQPKAPKPAQAAAASVPGWRAALTPEELAVLGDWEDAVDAITGGADAEVVEADLNQADLDDFRSAAVGRAILARVTEIAEAAAA